MTTLFDMAIDHFSQAQNAYRASDQLLCVAEMALGLQQFCAAIKASTASSNSYFPMAIDHFWRAQEDAISGSQLDCLGQMATGLQQFCVALRS
jgi:hypothetical protein